MIDHLEANLNLVIAEPDNIAARLVYADQLEDAGDSERAEFIRGQIAGLNCDYLLRANEFEWTPKCLRQLLVERTWRNGFVEDITVPRIADWIGEPCAVCEIDKLVITNPPKHGRSRKCNDRGYVGGIGWDAVKQTPVRVVRIDDRKPGNSSEYIFWQMQEHTLLGSHDLPLKVFKHLPNYRIDVSDHFAWYKSEDAAYAALSQALIEFVKKSVQ